MDTKDDSDHSLSEFNKNWHSQEQNLPGMVETNQIKDRAFKNLIDGGPLARSIAQQIKKEDFDECLIENDMFPLAMIFEDPITKSSNQEKRENKENIDHRESIEIAIHNLKYQFEHHARNNISFTFSKCQSPIESTLLGAMIIVFTRHHFSLHLGSDLDDHVGKVIYKSSHRNSVISIVPQKKLDTYQVDFLITIYSPENDYKKSLIIECDGHDFHEKTKQQIAADKKRERHLQSLGYHIFRFSGSEITKDTMHCAEEILRKFPQ